MTTTPLVEIPLFDLRFTDADRAAADAVLAGGWMTSGPNVEAFEADFGMALGGVPAERVVAVSSCTAALHLALLAAGIGPGDEVIVPALTFVAACNVVRLVGAEPVFADILSIEEPTLDPASLERVCTSRSRALIPVHYAGHPARLDALETFAASRELLLIEDAAHACITVLPNGGTCGTVGPFGAFSFFSNKNLAVGEGGALICRDRGTAALVRRLRGHGMTTATLDRHRGHAATYDVPHVGTNARWDEWRAAVLRERLRRLPGELARRRELDGRYRAELARHMPKVTVPFVANSGVPPHIFPVVLAKGTVRESVQARMREAGVQTSVHYPLLPAFSQFRGARPRGEWSNAADYSARTLTLPLYPAMHDADVDRVVAALAAALSA